MQALCFPCHSLRYTVHSSLLWHCHWRIGQFQPPSSSIFNILFIVIFRTLYNGANFVNVSVSNVSSLEIKRTLEQREWPWKGWEDFAPLLFPLNYNKWQQLAISSMQLNVLKVNIHAMNCIFYKYWMHSVQKRFWICKIKDKVNKKTIIAKLITHTLTSRVPKAPGIIQYNNLQFCSWQLMFKLQLGRKGPRHQMHFKLGLKST